MELLKSMLKRMKESASCSEKSKIAIYVKLDEVDDFLEICHDLGYTWGDAPLYPRKADDPIDTLISMSKKRPDGFCIYFVKHSNNNWAFWPCSKEACVDMKYEIISLTNLIDLKPAKFAKKLQDIVDMSSISIEERNTLLAVAIINFLNDLGYKKAADILSTKINV